MAKIALVTGSARRIGAAIVRDLHAKGYGVAVHYHTSAQAAEALIAELNTARSQSAVAFKADLSVVAESESLVDRVCEHFGGMDVLIHNAARFVATPMGTVTANIFQSLMQCNVTAGFFLTQRALPHLSKRLGNVILIADVHGMHPLKGYPVYSVTKAAVIALTKALAKECAPLVRVNAIAPGPTLWPEGTATLNAEEQAHILDKLPLKRLAALNDILAAMHYYAECTTVTGQILAVDSGRGL